MKGPSYRFTLVRDTADNTQLRFYISYLYFKQNNHLLNGYDLSVMQQRGLKHHFTEIVAEKLDIETEVLENGSFSLDVKEQLQTLLNDLLYIAKKCIIPNFYISWLNSTRADFFLYSLIKLSIKSNILITSNRYSKIYIGQVFWPKFNSIGHQTRESKLRDIKRKRIVKDREREGKACDPELVDQLVDKLIVKDKEEITKIQKEYEPYIEALRPIEHYDPVNDPNAIEKMIDHFHTIAFTKEAYRSENIRFITQAKRLYQQCYGKVPASRGIMKNDSSELINKTYERLIKQYSILRFYPPVENPTIRQYCIISFLDILYTTTKKEEFEDRFKLIGDKFSLDKSECKDFTLTFSQKQWDMLIGITESKYPSKIKQALNKIIRQEYKSLKKTKED
ncbi:MULTISPECIES: hypothetical protein [Vibrio]|uniref:hypothetical protein n=1 Tax=Vibrio TaxID=662 RepID=UPI0009763279|nr:MULTISPECIES: hypothetical protein [Vibrio]OMO34294.1 hypothetical protein BH584_13060 [Vibrio sp. 10N.261.45.E1]PMJ20396.1 hypothetical protein BCU27_20050 [Vibrio sp. 10N.286.45.B6]PMM89244.1 hypothetical protein BCT46_04565 [Vibrio sp. 10N.261.46.E8]